MRRPRLREAGLTLVEAAVVVCLVGVALAVFIPTFFRELRTSKVSEASEQLQELFTATASYYDARHDVEGDGADRACLPEAAGPTPSEPSQDGEVVDFGAEDLEGRDTWLALEFAPERPLRYRYRFTPAATGCGLVTDVPTPLVTLRAEGDLDGDSELSRFELSAGLDDEGVLRRSAVLYVRHRIE